MILCDENIRIRMRSYRNSFIDHMRRERKWNESVSNIHNKKCSTSVHNLATILSYYSFSSTSHALSIFSSSAFLCPSLSKRTFTAIMSTTSTSNKYRISHEIHPYAHYSQFIIDGEFSDRWQLFDSSLSRGSISDISTCSIDTMQGDVATTPDPDMNLKNPNQQNSPRPEISSNVFATDNYYPKKLEHPSRTMPKTIARKTKNCPPRRNMANAAA